MDVPKDEQLEATPHRGVSAKGVTSKNRALSLRKCKAFGEIVVKSFYLVFVFKPEYEKGIAVAG